MIPEKFEYLCLFQVESKGSHCDFKLVVVDSAVLVSIEELESFFDLLSLLVGKRCIDVVVRIDVARGGRCREVVGRRSVIVGRAAKVGCPTLCRF